MEIKEMFSNLITETVKCCRENRNEYILPEHLLFSMMKFEEFKSIMAYANADIESFMSELTNHLKEYSLEEEKYEKYMEWCNGSNVNSISMERIITHFSNFMIKVQQARMEHLLLSFYTEGDDNYSVYLLSKYGIVPDLVKRYIREGKFPESKSFGTTNYEKIKDFCADLVALAKDGKIDPVIGREEEIERIIKSVSRRKKNSCALCGEPGVGKTAVVEGLALKIANDEVPDSIKGFHVYALNMGALIAGTRFRGDFEERLKVVMDEVTKDHKSILFIDEMHTVIGAGSGTGESLNAGNIVKPYLTNGLICIGATTYDEYKNYILKDKAFSRRFQKIDVEEPNVENTVKIVSQSIESYEKHHGVKISTEVIEHAVKLSNFYINGRFQPDKTFDVIDEAGATYKSGYKTGEVVTKKDVEEVVCKLANIPSVTIKSDDRDGLKNLEENLRKNIFGQDEIIKNASKLIKSKKANLILPNRPLTLFFAGPSGCVVGETKIKVRKISNGNTPVTVFLDK